MKSFLYSTTFLFLFLISACKTSEEKIVISEEYKEEMNEWDKTRVERLKRDNGWLNLVGLYWLKEGENTFGSDKSNDIKFPEKVAADFMGKIVVNDSVITTHVNEKIEIQTDEKSISKILMKADVTGNPTLLSYKTLRWYIIKRGEKYGIRLRDLEADLVKNFNGIDRFPINENWKINATYNKYETPKKILVPSIIGTVNEELSPGNLTFTIDKKKYSLSPTASGTNLFIVFADLTSGEETYGAGRFLYVHGPDSNNIVELDFNKAYNPPCAFTKYATCPLPPDDNKLRVRITAGEKSFNKH